METTIIDQLINFIFNEEFCNSNNLPYPIQRCYNDDTSGLLLYWDVNKKLYCDIEIKEIEQITLFMRDKINNRELYYESKTFEEIKEAITRFMRS